jgi:Holliday junction resolvase
MSRVRSNRFGVRDEGKTPTDQENRIAKKTGGKRVSGSGSHPLSKSDVRDVPGGYGFHMECKLTEKGSIRVTKKWLAKICREAHAVQKWPALAFEIQGGEQDPLCPQDWVAIPVRILNELKGE